MKPKFIKMSRAARIAKRAEKKQTIKKTRRSEKSKINMLMKLI